MRTRNRNNAPPATNRRKRHAEAQPTPPSRTQPSRSTKKSAAGLSTSSKQSAQGYGSSNGLLDVVAGGSHNALDPIPEQLNMEFEVSPAKEMPQQLTPPDCSVDAADGAELVEMIQVKQKSKQSLEKNALLEELAATVAINGKTGGDLDVAKEARRMYDSVSGSLPPSGNEYEDQFNRWALDRAFQQHLDGYDARNVFPNATPEALAAVTREGELFNCHNCCTEYLFCKY